MARMKGPSGLRASVSYARGFRADLGRALLVAKATKVEHDLRRLRLSMRSLRAYYGPHARAIFASHERQLSMRARVAALLPEARLVTRDAMASEPLDRASLVVALGGDNHFVFLTHFLDSTPILGINADMVRSHGGLLSVDETNLEPAVELLRLGRLRLLRWPRIEAFVDGRPAGLATSEVFMGERSRTRMSRFILRKNGGPAEEHKSSGLIVATPAGSTGWYGGHGPRFSASQDLARWAVTEPFPRERRRRLAAGRLARGDALTVRSLNDPDEGILSVDCLHDTAFPFGSAARVRVSPKLLSVVQI